MKGDQKHSSPGSVALERGPAAPAILSKEVGSKDVMTEYRLLSLHDLVFVLERTVTVPALGHNISLVKTPKCIRF